jgi:protein TonB
MPPITKENETLTATPESPARSSTPTNGDGTKVQPVALEVPVTVNGARTIEGSDKREPFSETTKTVLIFGNGAVIRLTSSVAPGQLLFLTNERTKKEVVCQVVKSKNYRNVSGYVELEFTEPVVGFWGMRFPGDRIGPAPVPAPVAIPPAAVSSPVPPPPVVPNVAPIVLPPPAPVNVVPKAAEPNYVAPEVPLPSRPAAPVAPISSPGNSTALASSLTSSILALDSASLLGASKPKPTEIPAPPTAAVVAPPAAVIPPPPAAPPVAPLPQVPKESAEQASHTATGPNFDLSRQSDEQASFLAPPPQAFRAPATIDLSSLAPFFEVKPAAPAAAPPPPPPPPPAVDPETEALKLHTARLQEQLSSMLFAEPAAPVAPAPVAQEAPPAPVQEKKELQESIAQVLELAKPAAPKPEPIFAAPIEPVNDASEKKISSLEEEELKIPAWLEPLARNASAPSSTQELVLREKAKRVAETEPNEAETAEEPLAAPFFPAPQEEEAIPAPVPEFGSVLAIDESKVPGETKSKGSGKGLLFGAIAAGVLVAAAGGWWYLNQKPATPQPAVATVAAPASNPAASAPTKLQVEATNSTLTAEPPASRGSSVVKSGGQESPGQVSSSAGAATPGLSAVSVRTTQPSSPNSGKAIAGGAANARQPEPAPEEEKKSSLGEVHMAAPKLSQNRNAQSAAESDAGVSLDDGQTDNAADALGAGLSVGNKEPAAPAAPLPVGGDVKQAKLISRVDPIYPALAREQHISGNVTIDALIDPNGRVSTMKVISGPTMLHQAAMEALKQWKYQPATLDGKPVAMHLNITLQFRLQ